MFDHKITGRAFLVFLLVALAAPLSVWAEDTGIQPIDDDLALGQDVNRQQDCGQAKKSFQGSHGGWFLFVVCGAIVPIARNNWDNCSTLATRQ